MQNNCRNAFPNKFNAGANYDLSKIGESPDDMSHTMRGWLGTAFPNKLVFYIRLCVGAWVHPLTYPLTQ